jgi:hypothetical protein
MASLFEIDLGDEVSSIESSLALMPKKLDSAVQRAQRKLARWLAYHSARETGQVLELKASVIRRRFRSYHNSGSKTAKVWLGLDKIQLHHFKKMTYSNGKVFVPGLDQSFDNAFISKSIGQSKRDGKNRAWVRDESTESGLKAAEADISTEALQSLERWEKRANTRFNELLRQEVDYEFSKN